MILSLFTQFYAIASSSNGERSNNLSIGIKATRGRKSKTQYLQPISLLFSIILFPFPYVIMSPNYLALINELHLRISCTILLKYG